MLDAISLAVTYFAILLGFGVLLANVLKKRNIPDTIFLLLLGLLFSPTFISHPFVTQYISIKLVDVQAMGNIPDFLRILALILVVFTGTFNLNFRIFKRYSAISLKLAVIGVLINTIVLGVIAHFMFNIEILFAFLFASVISGTGSAVVFAFERALAKSRRALTIIKVESIFNSPISVLVPLIFLDLLYLTPGALIEPMKYLSQFWLMITAGVGTGLLIGLSVSRLFKGIREEYTPLLLFAIALITYALAIGVGGSGMLAVAICGLVASNFSISKKEDREKIIRFEDQLSEMLRISVFTLLGAQVTLIMGLKEFVLIILFFVLVVILRPLFLLSLMGGLKRKFSRLDIMLMSFIAPRGLPAAAMVPIIAAAVISVGQPAMADTIVNIVFMVILLSVLFSTLVAKIGSMDRFQKGPMKEEEQKEKEKEKESPKQEVRKKEDYQDLFYMLEEKEDSRG
ncbi:MAG: cation:proton antiporter [Candidatus Aenigmarchaeota archaeon]|nr:cation:proton antiporter [Candidatus Aenigmarchaeota archaeon]